MPRNGSDIYYIPPGTEGFPDTTIESEKYNNYIHDVETDLNRPRPIVVGGTGANDANEALVNLGGEKDSQYVENFDSHVWRGGSFRTGAGATSAPVAGHLFAGWVYTWDIPTDPPSNQNVTVQARDLSDTVVPGRVYVRQKLGGTWGAWSIDGTGWDVTKVNKAGDTMTGSLTVASGGIAVVGDSNITGKFYTSDRLSVTSGGIAVAGNSNFSGNVLTQGQVEIIGTGNNFTTTGGSIISAPTTTTGSYYFGNVAQNRTLYYNGSQYLFFGGDVTANGTNLRCSDLYTSRVGNINDGCVFFGSSNAKYIIYTASNNTYQVTGGDLSLNAGSVTAVGNITASGSGLGKVFASGSGGFNLTGQGVSLISDASTTWLNWASNALFSYSKGTGDLVYTVNSVPRAAFGGTGNFTVTGDASKPGGGSWSDSSDARIKSVQGDYTSGLDEVAQLRPVTFTFKGNDTPKAPSDGDAAPYKNSPHFQPASDSEVFRGLIAQEVETIFPEMVKNRSGFIDGAAVSDIRDLDTTALMYAFINALKELKARVEQLRGGTVMSWLEPSGLGSRTTKRWWLLLLPQ